MTRAWASLAVAALLLGCSKSDSGGAATNSPGASAGSSSGGAGGASAAGQAGASAGGASAGKGGGGGGGGAPAGGATSGGAGGASAGTGGSAGAPVAAQPCALTLSKVVALPKSSIASKARAFGPGVVPTPTGFLVAVHEVAEDGSEDVLSLVPVAADGTVGTTATAKLSACFGNYSTTGVGMTIRGGAGIATVARPACKSASEDTGGSLSLVAFGMGGDVQDIFLLNGPKGFAELTIPSHRSVAPVPGSALWRISYLQGATSYSFDASGITPKSGFNLLADKAVRVASASSQNLLIQAAELDGGLVVSATSAMMAQPKNFMLSKGTGVSASPFPSGVVVASRIGASTVRLDTIDDSANLVAQAQIPTPPLGNIDVAPVTKAIAIVVGDAKRVSVLVSTVPEVDFAPGVTPAVDVDPSNPLVTAFDGKAIAAAGGSGRVAAAWLSTSSPDSSSPLGGVALFECK